MNIKILALNNEFEAKLLDEILNRKENSSHYQVISRLRI